MRLSVTFIALSCSAAAFAAAVPVDNSSPIPIATNTIDLAYVPPPPTVTASPITSSRPATTSPPSPITGTTTFPCFPPGATGSGLPPCSTPIPITDPPTPITDSCPPPGATGTPVPFPPWCGDKCSQARASVGIDKYGSFNQACLNLVDDCLRKALTTDFIWSKTSCVAAATCKGAPGLKDLIKCDRPNLNVVNLPNLSYNVYADTVGACAWAPGGCSMTRQNYIDLFYRALEGIKSNNWPTAQQVIAYWNPIAEWTATGQTIPYVNFNDWLKYST